MDRLTTEQETPAQLEKVASVYRRQQVLQAMANDVFVLSVPGQQVLFVLLCFRVTAGAFMMTGAVKVRMLIGAACNWIYLRGTFGTLGRVYDTSTEAVNSWKDQGRMKWFRKFQRSCRRSLRVEMAGFYFVDTNMIITMFSIIVDGTISLLLTTQY